MGCIGLSFGNLTSVPVFIALPLLGLSVFPGRLGVRVDIVGVPPLAVGILSASAGMFNAREFDHTVHVMNVSSTTVHMYTAILQSCHFT